MCPADIEDGDAAADAAHAARHGGLTVTDVLMEVPGPQPVRVYLVVFAKEGPGHIIDLDDGGEVSFGRTPGATIVIDDPRISRRHAVIRRAGGDVFVRDLGSRNGTKVRGDVLRGEEKLVTAGDTIHVGPAEIVIAAVTRDDVKLQAHGARDPAEERGPESVDRAGDNEPASEDDSAFAFDSIVVADPAMQKVFRLARRLGQAPTTVLIAGETGVGKEVVAEQIHRWSARSSGAFVRLNCASLAETLLESELFGHEKGSFTGADRRKIGYVEAAIGGTLLLDEIGEMPMNLQAKLLRVIETKQIVRIGGTAEIPVDVRFLCATHRNLKHEVAAGNFREDLYYRISTFTLQVPPLRERPAEITLLADLFATHVAQRMGVTPPKIALDASEALLKHAWPGNVRELRNAIEHAVVMAEDGTVHAEHLPESVLRPSEPMPIESARAMKEQFAEVERKNVEAALAAETGNQTRAAKRLGITRRMLIYKMAKFGLKRGNN
jgi:transcriptional regulator with PAS, ATPase and Fis domain